MLRPLSLAFSSALLLAAPASAQQEKAVGQGNPAAMKAGSPEVKPGTPAPHVTNDADRVFSRAAAVGGMAEVELAKLVEKNSHNADVEAFAKRIIEDHGKANDKLTSIAEASSIPLPQALDQEHAAARTKLESMNDKEFDQAYLQGQVIDHQKTAQLFEYEIGSGEAAALKVFASENLPTILDHLRMAQDLQAKLTGKAGS